MYKVAKKRMKILHQQTPYLDQDQISPVCTEAVVYDRMDHEGGGSKVQQMFLRLCERIAELELGNDWSAQL